MECLIYWNVFPQMYHWNPCTLYLEESPAHCLTAVCRSATVPRAHPHPHKQPISLWKSHSFTSMYSIYQFLSLFPRQHIRGQPCSIVHSVLLAALGTCLPLIWPSQCYLLFYKYTQITYDILYIGWSSSITQSIDNYVAVYCKSVSIRV